MSGLGPSDEPTPRSPGEITVEERLHYTLALLSKFEFQFGKCPQCSWPKGGHHGSRHEPGCSLAMVLQGSDPIRLLWMEMKYGDAAFGAKSAEERPFCEPVTEPVTPVAREQA